MYNEFNFEVPKSSSFIMCTRNRGDFEVSDTFSCVKFQKYPIYLKF
jgi:hypothetical protein